MENTNADLTVLLETEKKHTAIINSLSSIFFALYYVDIEENVFQEIFSPDGIKYTYGEKDNAKARLKAVTDICLTVSARYRVSERFFPKSLLILSATE